MLVSPSILTCDFAHAGEVLALAKGCGADMLHLDVMDGVFVPNLSFGPPVIAALRPHSTLPFDVHLMMQYPDRLLEAFANCILKDTEPPVSAARALNWTAAGLLSEASVLGGGIPVEVPDFAL